MMIKMLLVYLVLTSKLVIAQINVAVVIAEERGGTGDITSNILAAMQLKKINPKWNVFLVGPETPKSNAVLKNVLPPSQKNILLPDIEYYSRSDFRKVKGKIKGDLNVALQFSTNATLPMPVENWAHSEAYFWEFSMADEHPTWKNYFSLLKNYRYYSTGPASLGMYINKTKPKPVLSLKETMDALSKVKEKTVYDRIKSGTKAKLAYSYATSFENTLKYAHFVYAAASDKFSNESIRLVLYDSNPDNASKYREYKPKNVELVVLRRRPLSLGFGLTAHADLPILMTGDFGPNLAIEYEKPFFMETHDHKELFYQALLKKFGRHLRQGNAAKTEKILDFDQLTYADRGLLTDEAYWDKFSNAINKFRGDISLMDDLSVELRKYQDLNVCLGK